MAVAQVVCLPGSPRAAPRRGGDRCQQRLAHRAPAAPHLYPAHARLNPPAEKHSHRPRRLAAIEAARGSFGTAVEAIEHATGTRLGKRQVEHLAAPAAADVDTFYDQRKPSPGAGEELLVISYDGAGVVMRRDAPRPATAKKAETVTGTLAPVVQGGNATVGA